MLSVGKIVDGIVDVVLMLTLVIFLLSLAFR